MTPRSPTLVALLSLSLLVPQQSRRVEPEGIPVRYAEGMVHGFLDLRTAAGELLANGDLLQIPRDRFIESRMVFHFPDSSLFEEEVTFTQHGVFALQTYKLVQRGNAFAEDLDVSLTRSGRYVVKTRSRDGREKRYEGVVDMPPDVYNGMVINIAKNLTSTETQTVHIVAFTPQPRLIRLEIGPSGEQRLVNERRAYTAVRYRLKPRLGPLLGFFARLTGKAPPDSHTWIAQDGVPAFVRYEGPLYSGPIWRIDLSAPDWPR